MTKKLNDQGRGSHLVANDEQPARIEATTSTRPFTPDSPDWEHGVRLSPCPSWCDGTHEMIANDEYAGGQLVGGDAIHTSPAVFVVDEKASIRGDGAPIHLEQHPNGENPDGPELVFVVCGDARLTPSSARQAASALLNAATLLEATR